MDKGTAMGTAKEPENHFVPVADRADLDQVFVESGEEPVVLFKHDFACHFSANAYRELAAVPGEVSLIDVERQKGLVDEVVSRTGIEHQSPQVIELRNGQPIYPASHWDISGEEVARGQRRVGGAANRFSRAGRFAVQNGPHTSAPSIPTVLSAGPACTPATRR